RRIALRIGINLGDIIAEGGDVFGDGVNIAARLEALAEPGSIYVSSIVHDQVVDKIDFEFDDLGPKELKNIRRPIHIYRLVCASGARAEQDARAAAALILAATNHHLMAERDDRDVTDLFELQDEIVTAIAGAIEPELVKFERERIAERPQHSEDAYELYQHGMFHHYRQNKAANAEAQGFFRRALAIDAQYPQATAALSIALSASAQLGWAENADAAFDQAYE